MSTDSATSLTVSFIWFLVPYVAFLILGGIVGFYLSDFATKLSGKEMAN